MNPQNQKHSIEKILSLIGVASASLLLSFPALAQNPATTGTNQQNPATTGTNQQNPATTGTNQQNPATTGTNQQNPAATGTNQQNPAATGTNQQNPAATGTNQQNPAATGTNQQNPSATGTNQPNGQQDGFTQYMNAGYAATQQRDYQNALNYFERARQLRPGNPYATRAIRNVRGYMQRGTTTTPTNQGRF